MRPSPLEIVLPATSANLGPAFDAAGIAMRLHFRVRAKVAREFSIEAHGRDNEIPIGKGLGSSAAARLAGIALAAHFGELGWTDDAVLKEAVRRECHGDNASACWLGGITLVHAEGAVKLRVRAEWPLLVAVPESALSTEHARSVLPQNYSRADAVTNIQSAMLLTAAFIEGQPELIRYALEDRIHQPYRGPLCPLLEPLRSLSGQIGVLGAALSGSGPSVLVVLNPEGDAEDTRRKIAALLHQKGLPAELLPTSMETHGARERRWLWSGTADHERRWPIPLP